LGTVSMWKTFNSCGKLSTIQIQEK